MEKTGWLVLELQTLKDRHLDGQFTAVAAAT